MECSPRTAIALALAVLRIHPRSPPGVFVPTHIPNVALLIRTKQRAAGRGSVTILDEQDLDVKFMTTVLFLNAMRNAQGEEDAARTASGKLDERKARAMGSVLGMHVLCLGRTNGEYVVEEMMRAIQKRVNKLVKRNIRECVAAGMLEQVLEWYKANRLQSKPNALDNVCFVFEIVHELLVEYDAPVGTILTYDSECKACCERFLAEISRRERFNDGVNDRLDLLKSELVGLMMASSLGG